MWKTKSETKPLPKVNKYVDVTVYKFVLVYDGKYISPYQGYSYELGGTYAVPEKLELIESDASLYIDNSSRYIIEEGIHSYYDKPIICFDSDKHRYFIYNKKKNNSSIRQLYKAQLAVLTCTIPKGSEYYIDEETGNVVSEKIRIDSVSFDTVDKKELNKIEILDITSTNK